MMNCRQTRAVIDAWIDGEAAEPEHVRQCASCRREADARRALRDRLRALRLPAPPVSPRLPVSASPRLWRVLPASAAAALVVGLLFLVQPARSEPVPEIVTRAAEFHDLVVGGRIRAAEASRPDMLAKYFRDRLNLDVVVPPLGKDASLTGGCCGEFVGPEGASPCILYRIRGIPLTLLVVESELPNLPASARRIRGGQEYFVFRCRANIVVLCRSGSVCHLWVSSMEEASLLATILETSVGRMAFSGERLTLRGVT